MSNKLSKKNKTKDKKSKVPYQLKLSQCMIVKNEEDNIRRALSWGKDIMMEQIVVDTGSTDCTIEIAEKMGAKVFHFDWINDFAAARNYAIEQAKGEWIAFLDADEYLQENDKRRLVQILNYFDVNGITKEKKIDVIRTELANVEEDGRITSVDFQDRVFRRDENLRYKGKIHEAIEYRHSQKFIFYHSKEITILHTGYQERFKESKGRRNEAILSDLVKSNDKDYELKSYLADSLHMKKDKKGAYELYYECLKNIDLVKNRERKHKVFLGMYNLLLGHYNPMQLDPMKLHDSFLQVFPGIPDAKCFMGIYFYNQRNYTGCIEMMKQAMTLSDHHQNDFKEISLFTRKYMLNHYLGLSYYELGQFDLALPCLILYQKSNKQDEDSLFKLLNIILQEKLSEQDLKAYILQILGGLYQLGDLRDTLICIKAAKLLRLEALAEALQSYLSDSDREWLKH